MTTLLGSPLAQAIGWALLHLIWQGFLVAAVLFATLTSMRTRSANARYIAASTALALLVALFAATTLYMYDAHRERSTSVVSHAAGEVAGASAETVPEVPSNVTNASAGASIAAFVRAHLAQFLLLWMAGVAVLSLRLTAAWLQTLRLASRSGVEASERWQQTMRRLSVAMQLKRGVRLLESAAVEVPTVIGWLRPVVLLPMSALTGLAPEQLEMMLAHELAHVRRHDFIINLLQSMVETLFFYHPAVWWISNRMRIEREHCCDDAAVAICGSPLQYARALTRLEELRSSATLAVAANGGSLLDRIRRVVGIRAEGTNSSSWAAGAALATVLVAMAIYPALPLFALRFPPAPAAPPAPPAATLPPRAPLAIAPVTATPHAAHSTIEVVDGADHSNVADDDDAAFDGEDEVQLDVPLPPQAGQAVIDREELRRIVRLAKKSAVSQIPELRELVRNAANGAIAGFDELAPMAPMAPLVTIVPPVALAPLAHPAPLMYTTPHVRVAPRINAIPRPAIAPMAAPAPMVSPMPLIEVTPAIAPLDPVEAPDAPPAPPRPRLHSPRTPHASSAEPVDDVDAVISARQLDRLRAICNTASDRQLTALAMVGVTPEWIAEMKRAGVLTIEPRKLIALRTQGVDSRFVAAMRAAGVSSLSTEQLIRARVFGIDGAFLKSLNESLNESRHGRLSLDQAIRLRQHGVDLGYVDALRIAGFANLPAETLMRLRDYGVSPEYIAQLRAAGVRNMSAQELMELRKYGVSESLLDMLKRAGRTNLTPRQLIETAKRGVTPELLQELEQYRTTTH
jgi:beta-lactamase regulating signal transducer with metallopeptidase domain